VDEYTVLQLSHRDGVLSTVSCGLAGWGSNEAAIIGTEGAIRLCQPFFRPDCLTLRQWKAIPVDSKNEQCLPTNRWWQRSKLFRHALSRARVLKQATRTGHRFYEPMRCNGYEYGASAVQDCLNDGLSECPPMTLADSQDAIDVLVAARESMKGEPATVTVRRA
jgi:hypothetical protein